MHPSHLLPNHSMFLKGSSQALAHQSEVEGKSITDSEAPGEEQPDTSANEDKVSVLGDFLQMQTDLNGEPLTSVQKEKKRKKQKSTTRVRFLSSEVN